MPSHEFGEKLETKQIINSFSTDKEATTKNQNDFTSWSYQDRLFENQSCSHYFSTKTSIPNSSVKDYDMLDDSFIFTEDWINEINGDKQFQIQINTFNIMNNKVSNGIFAYQTYFLALLFLSIITGIILIMFFKRLIWNKNIKGTSEKMVSVREKKEDKHNADCIKTPMAKKNTSTDENYAYPTTENISSPFKVQRKTIELATPLSLNGNMINNTRTGFDNNIFSSNNDSPKSFNYNTGPPMIKRLSDRFIAKINKNSKKYKLNSSELISNIPIFYENNKFNNSFTSCSLIGQGKEGKVYKALHKLEGKYYAIKKIDVQLQKNENLRDSFFSREVGAMMNMYHKNIIRFVTSWIEKEELDLLSFGKIRSKSDFLPLNELGVKKKLSDKESEDSGFDIVFEEEINKSDQSPVRSHNSFIADMRSEKEVENLTLYIQMEYCKGTCLSTYLAEDIKLNENDYFFFFNEIVNGLTHIHSKNLIHRGLKPSNIFITKSGEIKIGDFGLLTIKEKKVHQHRTNFNLIGLIEPINEEDRLPCLGTSLYRAPEIEASSFYDNKVDVYSLGIILFEMMSGFKSFPDRVKALNELRKCSKVSEDFKAKYPNQSELIEMMIHQDQIKRLSVEEIFQHTAYMNWNAEIRHRYN